MAKMARAIDTPVSSMLEQRSGGTSGIIEPPDEQREMTRAARPDAPLVSAVVPAHNASRYIGHTLRSLVDQTYSNLQIVVIDDGSRDETFALVSEMARAHPQIRAIQQPCSGVAAARNRGIRASRGEFIAPIDADDIWFPEATEKLVNRLLRSGPRVGLAYAWSVTIDEGGRQAGRYRCSMIEGEVFGTLLCHNFIGNASSTLIRRSCLERVGGYDGDFRQHDAEGCEDWDLYLRIAEQYRFSVVPEVLVGYRRVRGSMSSNAAAMARSHSYLLQKVDRQHRGIPGVLYRLSTSSLYLYLADECHRQMLPRESRSWRRQALKSGPFLTLLRPVYYSLAVRNARAAPRGSSRGIVRAPHSDARQITAAGSAKVSGRKVGQVTPPGASVRIKILVEKMLQRAVSWLPIAR